MTASFRATLLRSTHESLQIAIIRAAQHSRRMLRQLTTLFVRSSRSRHPLTRHRLPSPPASLESLECRVLLAAYAGSGTTMTLTLAADETVTIVSTASDTYTFTLSSGSWSGSGTTSGMSASGTTLTANSTAKSTFSSFVITKASATAGTDVIFGDSAAAYTDIFTVTQTGTGLADVIQFNGSTLFSGSSSLTIDTNRRIEFSSGASVQSASGNITMTANSSGTAAGTFAGLLMNAATLKSTGTGNISLTATGGSTYTSMVSNHGIWILDSLVQTSSGTITMNGTGGSTDTAPDNLTCAGIEFIRSTVQSVSAGIITLTGTGGDGASNTGDCDGISLEVDVLVSTTGAGSITMNGTAKNNGQGISSWDNVNNRVVAGSGGLVIAGTGERNVGVGVYGLNNSAVVFDSPGGQIQITGTGQINRGLELGNMSIGSATTSSVSITATGGSVTASGDDDGMTLINTLISINGPLTLTGTAGASGEAIEADFSSFTVTSFTASGTTPDGDAIEFESLTLSTTGNASFTGTCASGTGDDDGTIILNSTLTIGGTATVSGTARDTGEAITLTSTALNANTLQMTGNSVNSDSIDMSAATISAGSITITGSRSAILVNSSITATTGDLTLLANNAATAAGTFTGISLTNSTLRAQNSGNLSLTGKGGTAVVATAGNEGIATFSNSLIETASGSITLAGTAGSYTGTDTSVTVAGVNLDTTTVRSTAAGNISITGTGATGTGNNGDCDGVNLEQLSLVSTTGAGRIEITGTGSGSGEGIDSDDQNNNQIVAGSGGLTLNGNAPLEAVSLTGSANTWVLLSAVNGPVTINATSSIGDALAIRNAQLGSGSITNLTINAAGGNVTGSDDDDGIYLSGIAAAITGTLTLTGTARDTGEGIEIFSSTISASSISLAATTGDSDALGIFSSTVTATGGVTISATCTGGSGDNDGILITSSSITAGTTLSLTGVAASTGEAVQLTSGTLSAATFQSNGTGVDSNGFEMDSGTISAATVSITTSTAAGSAQATRLYNSAAVTATGSSGLTITSTGGVNGLQMETAAGLRASNGPVTVSAGKNLAINTGTITSDGVGSISLTANGFTWSGAGAAINAGTGTVTLVPTTTNWPIVLGAADTSSATGLESAELSIIAAGTLLIGTIGNTQPITIAAPVSAATAGNITLRSAGGIEPNATGTDLTLGSGRSLSFPSGTSILIAVSGNTVDSGYSRFNVVGTLNLNGTMLSLSGSYVPVSGDVLTVVNATTLSGTFTGLANNAVTSLNSEPLLVNYTAASGTLSAYVAPTVTTHPVSTGVTAGTVVSFTAAASGLPTPTIQWQVSTNNGTSWTNLSGETSGTLSFTAAAGDSGKQYRAVFTNAEGSSNTNTATLLVGTLPVFSSRNVMTAGEGVGTGLYITAAASPTPTFSVTAGTLPAGLTLDPVTGLLSGTPAAGSAGGSSQNYPVTILASNGIGSGTTQNLNITITTGIVSFDVSKGLSQRSYIRYVDLTLASATTASAIVSSGSRMTLMRTDLDGNGSTAVPLTGFINAVGGRIALDFGTVGIGNARNTSLADGYYTLAVDLDNDGQREAEFAFFRLFGDLNGDREVNSTDLSIAANGARSAYSAEADANGDGFVTSTDVLYVRRTLSRRLRNGLWLAD
jgi:hypothetical protein